MAQAEKNNEKYTYQLWTRSTDLSMWYGDSTQNSALNKIQTQYFAENPMIWAPEAFETFEKNFM